MWGVRGKVTRLGLSSKGHPATELRTQGGVGEGTRQQATVLPPGKENGEGRRQGLVRGLQAEPLWPGGVESLGVRVAARGCGGQTGLARTGPWGRRCAWLDGST